VEAQKVEGAHVLKRGPFSVDIKKHTVHVEDELLDLSRREFSLLVHLLESAPEVVSPVDLARVVRNYEPEHLHEARDIIKWYVHRLRRKIEPNPANPRYIVNVRGVGYRFDL
jgi:two-component system response regulator RegX3